MKKRYFDLWPVVAIGAAVLYILLNLARYGFPNNLHRARPTTGPRIVILNGHKARFGCDTVLAERGIEVDEYTLTVHLYGNHWRLHGFTIERHVFTAEVRYKAQGWHLVSLEMRIR